MRHGMANKKLNRTSEHRKALLKNMLNSLIKYEQITTTLPKAKFLKPQADKIITLGKKETLQTTKMLMTKLQDIKSANKVKKTLSYFNIISFKNSDMIAKFLFIFFWLLRLNFEIEIDGGVNRETSQLCKNSGANVLVAGSYIFSGDKDNYKTLIDSLR